VQRTLAAVPEHTLLLSAVQELTVAVNRMAIPLLREAQYGHMNRMNPWRIGNRTIGEQCEVA
jgi:hypothetical protein